MRIKDNFHTHIYLCKHAKGNVSDYVKKAIDLNYESIGISDHGPLLPHNNTVISHKRMSFEEFYSIYLKEISQAKELFKNDITVLGALEIEFYDHMLNEYPKMLKELDYLILGQHRIEMPDLTYKSIFKCKPEDDINLCLNIYTEEVIKGLNTGFFSILAHPDLFMQFYQKWDNSAILSSKRIIETAIKNNVILELNANGIRKGLVTTPEGIETYNYPRIEFWKLVATYKDAKVIVSDDSHKLKYLHDEATIKAYEIAEELKLNLEEDFPKRLKQNKDE